MPESDLHPTASDANATTKTLRKNPMALKLSPETATNIQLGSLITAAGAIVVATIFVWTIKINSETAMADGKAMREEVRTEFRAIRVDLQPIRDKVERLWWEYERTATAPSPRLGGQP